MTTPNPAPWQNMVTVLTQQLAISQAQLQATNDMRAALDQMGHQLGSSGAHGTGPNGGRPTFNGNGVRRPSHGGHAGYHGGLHAARMWAANAFHRSATAGGAATNNFEAGSHFEETTVNGVQGYNEHRKDGTVQFHPDTSLTTNEAQIARSNPVSNIARAGATASLISGHHGGAANILSNAYHNPAIRAAGAVALGAEAVNYAFGQVGHQREANAQYQAVLGGSNWSTGFHNRRLEAGFKLGQRFSGGFTGDQATEAFRGVTAMGMIGTERDSALGFMTSNYKNLGMSAKDSLALLSITSKTLNSDLGSLKDALTEVSKAAKATGQNLEVARKNFTETFAAIAQVNSSTQGVGIASTISTAITGMGRTMQGFDVMGLAATNQGHVLQAGLLGMSLGQYEGATRSTNGASVAAQGMDRAIAVALGSYAQQLSPKIMQLVEASGGKDKVAQNIGGWVKDNMGALFGLMPDGGMGLVASLAAVGVKATPDQAVEYLVRQVIGDGSSFTNQADQLKKSMLGTPTTSTGKIFDTKEEAWSYMRDTGHKDDFVYRNTGKEDFEVLQKGSDPLIDKFGKNYSKAHVVVKTKDGDRVVTGAEAAQYYSDQIAMGTATFADNNPETYGRSVKDVVGQGYAEDNYYSIHPDAAHTADQAMNKDAKGKSADDWQNKLNKNGGVGGRVEIAPNAELQKILTFYSNNNSVYVATDAAANGYTPLPGMH